MAATAGTACTCGAEEYCDPVNGCQLCSLATSSYQEILCSCDASRDAVVGCTPEVKEEGNLCRNRSKALEECSRRGYTPDHSPRTATSAGTTTTTRPTTALTANGTLFTSAILQTHTAALASTRAAERLSTPLPVSRQYLPGGFFVVFILALLVLMMVFVLLYHCQKSRQMKRLYANHETLPLVELGAVDRDPRRRSVDGNESASNLSGSHDSLEPSEDIQLS